MRWWGVLSLYSIYSNDSLYSLCWLLFFLQFWVFCAVLITLFYLYLLWVRYWLFVITIYISRSAHTQIYVICYLFHLPSVVVLGAVEVGVLFGNARQILISQHDKIIEKRLHNLAKIYHDLCLRFFRRFAWASLNGWMDVTMVVGCLTFLWLFLLRGERIEWYILLMGQMGAGQFVWF